MRLHPVRWGLALGTAHAVIILVTGTLSAITSQRIAGDFVRIFSSLYYGFRPTFIGIGIGVLWAFFAAFAVGFIIANVFNFFSYIESSDEYE